MRYGILQRDNLNHIWAIMIINLLVLIATFIEPKLIYILGLRGATVLQMPWTLVTNLFTHSGIWHVLSNMLTLYFFGSFLTRLVGVRNFLIIYFCGGLAGNLLYLLLASPLNIAVGASGAVFSLGGALTVITPKLKVLVFPIPVPVPLWIAVIGGFLLLSLVPYIAWQAHLGGLLFGLLAGLYLRKKTPSTFY